MVPMGQRTVYQYASIVSPSVSVSHAPGERAQLAAKFADMLRNASFLRDRRHMARQITDMVAGSRHQSDAISIAPIVTPAKGVDSEDDLKYMRTFTQVLHFAGSCRPKMGALDWP